MADLPALTFEDRVWHVWVEDRGSAGADLCSESGKTGGKMRQSRKTITEAGRHPSPLAQALHDAHKKWQDKINKEGYTRSDGLPTEQLERSELCSASVRTHMAVARTGDSVVLPMLAHPAVFVTATATSGKTGKTSKTGKSDAASGESIKRMPMPCMAQPKLDGFRGVGCVATGELFSRKNLAFQGFPSVRNAMAALAARLPSTGGFGSGRFYLDGELHMRTHGNDFSKLSGVMKRAQNDAAFDDPGVVYRVFDCLDLDHMDAPFRTRLALLRTLIPAGPSSAKLELVDTTDVTAVSAVRPLLNSYISAGHEGLMLRDPDAPYVLKSRSYGLQKVKLFEEAEFRIVGHHDGEGSEKNAVIWECVTPGNEHFSVRPEGSVEARMELFRNAQAFYGRMLTVKYQELSASGVPRFPVGKGIREEFD